MFGILICIGSLAHQMGTTQRIDLTLPERAMLDAYDSGKMKYTGKAARGPSEDLCAKHFGPKKFEYTWVLEPWQDEEH